MENVVRTLSTLALMGAIRKLASHCEAKTTVRIEAKFAPTQTLLARLRSGEHTDIVVLTREGLDEIIQEGFVARASATDLARSYVGIAVRAGQPHPDISTEGALRRTLIENRVVYSRFGASGIYFGQLIERLGIAAEVNARAIIIQQGLTGKRLLTPGADLAVQQISELKQVDGIEVIGSIPYELQTPVLFSAGRIVKTRNAAGADRVLKYLASPEVTPVFRESGLEA